MVLAARRLLGAGVGRRRVRTRAVGSLVRGTALARPAGGGRRAVASLGRLAASPGIEALLEVGDGLVQDLLVWQLALVTDLLEHARLVAPEEGDELSLEAPHRGHGDVVDKAVRAGVDGHHL